MVWQNRRGSLELIQATEVTQFCRRTTATERPGGTESTEHEINGQQIISM